MTAEGEAAVTPSGYRAADSTDRSRTPRSLLATVTAGTLIAVSALIGAGEGAHALPLPLDPDDPVVSDIWTNPIARADDQNHEVELEILEIHPPGADSGTALEVGGEVAVRLRISNNTSDTLSQITLLAQRQEAAWDNAAARVATAANGLTSYPYYGTQVVLPETIAPGESTDTTMRISTDAADAITLAITQPGSYPLRIALSGQLDGVASHLDSQRFLLPVTAAPGTETPATPETPETTLDPALAAPLEEEPGTPTTLLFPLTTDTELLGGETGEAPEYPPLLMSSEDLAGELAAEGRLSRLIDAFLAAPLPVREAACLAIDPELLTVVERMTDGYTISDQRVSSAKQNQRLRDLWTASNQPTAGVPGSGVAAAEAFLEKLRTAAADTCTVALPWANTDLNAVTDTGNRWLLREALQRGSTTISEVLGVTPLDNVVIPGGGYVSPTTAANLGLADTSGEPATLEQAWEVQASNQETATANTSRASLDDPEITPPETSPVPPPATPVKVLVADNTVWRTPTADRFHQLAPGITAVSYQGSLSATLATLGAAPETVGYANPASRFDYTMDSRPARTLSGQAAIRLTVDKGDADTPVLIMPPAQLEATDATMILNTAAELLDSGQAQPFTLPEYLNPNAQQQSELAAAVASNGLPDPTSFGAPFADPAAITETEILRVTQQSSYIDDLTGIMFNDAGIVLTRYGFTAPLRQDLLRAMTLNTRRTYTGHASATAEADRLLNENRDALQQLRSSVALLPPGNVYTRTSNSSPLIIVAQNGLPLPAAAQILYAGPENAKITTPGVIRIPARGSLTLQMTADLPDDNQRTDLTVWLASPEGATISDPVEITVQPRPNIMGTVGIVALGILVLGALLVFRVFKIRRKNQPGANPGRPGSAGQAPRPSTAVTTRATASRATASRRARGGSKHPSRHVARGHGRADDGSGSPKPPGSN